MFSDSNTAVLLPSLPPALEQQKSLKTGLHSAHVFYFGGVLFLPTLLERAHQLSSLFFAEVANRLFLGLHTIELTFQSGSS